jgi:putative DNA primase/helicase
MNPAFEAEIRKYISDIMATKEAVTFIQDLMSYIVTKYRTGHCIIVFHGNGSNGKTVLERLIRTMVGMYCVVGEIKVVTKKGGAAKGAESKLMSTGGALCVLFPELDARDKLNSGKVKQLTVNDSFQARELYGVATENEVNVQMIVSCNFTLNVSETSEGMMRRPKIVPFLMKFLDKF